MVVPVLGTGLPKRVPLLHELVLFAVCRKGPDTLRGLWRAQGCYLIASPLEDMLCTGMQQAIDSKERRPKR